VQEYKAEEIIDGLRNRDTNVLDFVYKSFFQQIKVFINKNSGSDEDAQDIYQDAVLVIYQKIKSDNLTLNCSFNTYLYSVCRLLWLKQLEKRKKSQEYVDDSKKIIELDDDILKLYNSNERYVIYQDHFKKLSQNCQKILELYMARIQLKEIANILGYKSDQYVKKRKHQCKEKLVSSIKNDPRYKELLFENQ
jgi:RNA polymerase sigma factor (sigma-70 family)